MPPVERVLTPINGYDAKALPLALQEAVGLCNATGSREIVLLVPSRPKLANFTLAAQLGAANVKALAKGNAVPVPGGISLSAESWGRLHIGSNKTVVIVYYADDRELERIDGVANVVGVVAVLDQVGGAPQWVARWNPTVPGQPATPPAVLIADARIEKAMESLTKGSNLSKGVLGPIEKVSAMETFRILRNKEHKAEPGSIKSWAIQNGWKPTAAAELEKIAQRAFGLKAKPSLANVTNAQQRYDRWV